MWNTDCKVWTSKSLNIFLMKIPGGGNRENEREAIIWESQLKFPLYKERHQSSDLRGPVNSKQDKYAFSCIVVKLQNFEKQPPWEEKAFILRNETCCPQLKRSSDDSRDFWGRQLSLPSVCPGEGLHGGASRKTSWNPLLFFFFVKFENIILKIYMKMQGT